MFKLPYSVLPPKVLKKVSRVFYSFSNHFKSMKNTLDINLKRASIEIEPREYLSMCFCATSFFFILVFLIALMFVKGGSAKNPLTVSLIISIIFSAFVFMQQIMYPKLLAAKKARAIDKNLLPALQNMIIQLNSGTSLFNVLVSISIMDYGDVSKEFTKIIKEINAGKEQSRALEDAAATNPSEFFRATIWQLINGMKSGANISGIINDSIETISQERLIQIQKYGSQLNPLAMFYMLVAVIIPSLSMTFLIVIGSIVSVPEIILKSIFWGLYGIVLFFQVMFIGIIKSRKPNLLND